MGANDGERQRSELSKNIIYLSRLHHQRVDALMEESAQTALAYEQRAQEDAQTIETLAAQAESLSQAEAGQGTAPSAAPSLTLPPMPTARPLYTIPMPEK